MKWVERWIVESFTSNKEYVVSIADDNKTWGCSCPAWIYQRHRIRDGICKHIREVKRTYESNIQSMNDSMRITHDDFFTEEEFTL